MDLFSADERRDWLNARLSPDDTRLADQCISAGISPDDLQIRVNGVRAAALLRGGESVTSIRLLIEEPSARFNPTPADVGLAWRWRLAWCA